MIFLDEYNKKVILRYEMTDNGNAVTEVYKIEVV